MAYTIFNANSVLDRINKARNEGTFPQSVLNIDWAHPHEWENVRYVRILYKTEDGKQTPLLFRFANERQSGGIPPGDVIGLEELKRENPQFAGKIREYGIRVPFNKWSCRIEVDDNNKMTEVPDPQYKSTLFAIVEAVEEVFVSNVETMIKQGMLCTKQRIPPSGMPHGGLVVRDLTYHKPIQWAFSENAKKFANEKLTNPILRLRIQQRADKNFAPSFVLYDKSKPLDDKKGYELLVDDEGNKVNANNIHKLLRSGCLIDGVADSSTISLSRMGISFGVKLMKAVVAPRNMRSHYQDIYGDVPEDDTEPF